MCPEEALKYQYWFSIYFMHFISGLKPFIPPLATFAKSKQTQARHKKHLFLFYVLTQIKKACFFLNTHKILVSTASLTTNPLNVGNFVCTYRHLLSIIKLKGECQQKQILVMIHRRSSMCDANICTVSDGGGTPVAFIFIQLIYSLKIQK